MWLRVQRGVAQFTHLGEGAPDAYNLLIAGAVLLSLSLIGEVVIVADFLRNGTLANSLPLALALVFDLTVIGVAILAALQRPSPFDWIYQFGAALKGENFSMSDAECADCARAFEALVQKQGFANGEKTGTDSDGAAARSAFATTVGNNQSRLWRELFQTHESMAR